MVLGWDREKSNESYEVVSSGLHMKRFLLGAPYGKISLLSFYPLFWTWIFINLMKYRPRVVHSCDFDCLLPCLLYRPFLQAKVVFDSFDKYAMAFIPQKHRALYLFVDSLENMMANKADALVTVSNDRLATFGRFLPKRHEVIMNCPEGEATIIRFPPARIQREKLTIVYAGSLAKDRGLSILSEALSDLDDVRLILAGRADEGYIKPFLNSPKVKYFGMLRYDEAIKLQASADLIPLLYDPSVPINRVANPNKLFEAMMLGIPVVSNVCQEIVKDAHCGLPVSYDAKCLRNAIMKLRDDFSLRTELGDSGRKAFENIYNWKQMEEKLFRLYNEIVTNNLAFGFRVSENKQ
jgi:glycosyltransferase involved in cell wall biosynthesis